MRRYEPDIAVGEVRPRDAGQEVRDVPEPITELAGEVPAVVDRVHLVDPDVMETVGCVLDRIEHRSRLSVRKGNDDLRPVVDVCQYITWLVLCFHVGQGTGRGTRRRVVSECSRMCD